MNKVVTEARGTASINLEDGQIRFWPDDRLPKDLYNETRNMRLSWSRGEQCFKCAWSPHKVDVLAEQFGIVELADDETNLLDQAESRADYFEGWSNNASKRSDERYAASKAATAGIPFGQPILVGHHSEQRHRNAIKRSWNNLGKSVEESKRAEYWGHRAERAVKSAEYKQRPGVISRRIDKLETELRSFERMANKELWIAKGEEKWAIHRGNEPEEVWKRIESFATRWIVYLTLRIEYQKALLKASGGLATDEIKFKVGDYINSWVGWAKVLRVNKKSITVQRPNYSWAERIKYSDVKGHRKATDIEGMDIRT